jgi:hypothetical protein
MQLGDQVNAIRHLAMFFAKFAVAVDLKLANKLLTMAIELDQRYRVTMATVYYLLISIVSELVPLESSNK